jgi:hypothetical protein
MPSRQFRSTEGDRIKLHERSVARNGGYHSEYRFEGWRGDLAQPRWATADVGWSLSPGCSGVLCPAKELRVIE